MQNSPYLDRPIRTIEQAQADIARSSKTAVVRLDFSDGYPLLVNEATGNDLLIQTDLDYPSVACNLGFIPCEHCSHTDGTVDCDHFTAAEMIAAAYEFLTEHRGMTFEDPGYFS